MSELSALFKRQSFHVASIIMLLAAALMMASVTYASKSFSDDDDDRDESNYKEDRDDDDNHDRDDDRDEYEKGTPLQILWTNDTHGFFLPVYHAEYSEIDTYEKIAAKEGKVGGYAQISGLVKKFKRGFWGPRTLFVDAGDTFDGSPVAQLTRGAAVVPILNAMGYDAWTPGNRDFAWSQGNFADVSSQLTIPTVCANLLDANGDFPFPRFIIKEVEGVKVAMIGLTSLAGISSAGGPREYSVLGGNIPGPLLENSVSDLAAEIRATENPDIVIVLSHLGYFQDQKLASRTTGIDVFVGAHTHHNVRKAPVVPNLDGSRDVIVAQAGSHGKYLGRLKLWLEDGKVADFENKIIRVSERSLKKMKVEPDPVVDDLAQAAYAPFKDMLDEVIGTTTTVIERRGDTQSTMTNFLTNAIAERYGVVGSRFPGIRYGSSNIPGPVTVGDVWNIVSPNFGNNRVFTYTLSGGAIRGSIFNGLGTVYGTDPYLWNGGDVFRYNDRIRYTYNADVNNPTHLVDLSVTTLDGEVVDLVKDGVNQVANFGRVFTFAGTAPLPGAQNIAPVAGVNAVDEIVDYIKSKGTISPALDDRTVQLDDAPANEADVR
jgi:2',3'-cyclic-nucleotide 2'-phosphodiesterase (5'-nucleotidase family)